MTPWLNVCGAGLVHSLPHLAESSLTSLKKAHETDFIKPDVQALAELLKAWRGGDCPPLRRIPTYARMGLLAALQALGPSEAKEHGHEDMALVIGTAHSGIAMSMDFMDSILDAEPRLSSPTAFSHAVNNMGAGLISLLLDVRGPCQTVSQFELSFAGAVQAAALLLHAGRASKVLVGALDEYDARFRQCCPSMTSVAQGAVFFCLEKASESFDAQERAAQEAKAEEGAKQGHIRVGFGQNSLSQATSREMLGAEGRILLSGCAAHENGQNLTPYYGESMLGQALDVYLALQSQGHSACLCTERYQQRSACIEVVSW